METKEKKEKIAELVLEMLEWSHENMKKKIQKAINCGAIDIDGWDPNNKQMAVPKCIVAAMLRNESWEYEGRGTSFEKKIKRDIENIQLCI